MIQHRQQSRQKTESNKLELEQLEAVRAVFVGKPRDILLPWPDRALSPNSRAHWAVKARAVRDALDAAYWATCEQKLTSAMFDMGGMIKLTFYMHRRDRRNHDNDNCAAACKSYRDGIALALGIDDKIIESHAVIVRELGYKVVARLHQ